MKSQSKWIIGILLEHLILAIILGTLWGSLTTQVDNVTKQSDKMEQKIDKIYELLLGVE